MCWGALLLSNVALFLNPISKKWIKAVL